MAGHCHPPACLGEYRVQNAPYHGNQSYYPGAFSDPAIPCRQAPEGAVPPHLALLPPSSQQPFPVKVQDMLPEYHQAAFSNSFATAVPSHEEADLHCHPS